MHNNSTVKEVDLGRHTESEDRERLLSESDSSEIYLDFARRVSRPISWPVIIALLLVCSICSSIIGAWVGRGWLPSSDPYCLRKISQYSPVIHDVDILYSTVQFQGSLLKLNAFRQDAGPEVDAAWKSLGVDFHAARVADDLAARSNLAPDQVKIKQKYGGGYPAHVEGLHHLHCLNLLRKSLYYNIDYYRAQGLGPFKNSPGIVKYHITHCLDILRQQLMCTVDVGVLGQVWYKPPNKTEPEAFVDFNTQHKCRNFDAVKAWAEKHQLPDIAPLDFLEPPKEGDRIWDEVP
ncbi:hypothetical protein M501DRAFT_595923 [Patellaria atrata CBS 101060]|uniref:Tat pathway signal sequence n=1 Tax=Patellaria atrata CBS 101060 TaxID=1346257 RepID=A0A9P4VLQ2_9PEZI|nr:hypothetical protein M501DRAFT_595923 [Patellaria atrata CBS 101060]